MKKTITLVCMRWPDYDEPICAGHNKRNLKKEALEILRAEHGCGNVPRPQAFCEAPIEANDLHEFTIPLY